MTTQTTLVGAPQLPKVNLLPPEIGEARTLRQYRIGAAGMVAVAVIGVGLFYFHGKSSVTSAQDALSTSQDQTTTLQHQVTTYQGVTAIKAQVAQAQATLSSTLAPQILWSHYLQDMSVSLVGNYWLTQLTLTAGGGGAGTTPGAAAPYADTGAVGTAQVQGMAVSHQDVAILMNQAAAEAGLSHPMLNSSSEAGGNSMSSDPQLTKFSMTWAVDSNGKPNPAAPSTPNGSTPATTKSGGS